jgi:hypothetical protein
MRVRELTDGAALNPRGIIEFEFLVQRCHVECHHSSFSSRSDLEHIERPPFPANYLATLGLAPGTGLIEEMLLALPQSSQTTCAYRNPGDELNSSKGLNSAA